MKRFYPHCFCIVFAFSFTTGKAFTNFGGSDSSKFPIVISFFSVASGIDVQARAQVDSLILAFETDKKISLPKEETRWGREGEIDYCMALNQLSGCDRKKFINKVKKIAKKSGRISVLENSTCLHKR